MATLKDMKRILSFLFSAWLCVPIIDTFSAKINTAGLLIGAWIDEFLPYAGSNLKGLVHLTETLQQILQVSTVGIIGHLFFFGKIGGLAVPSGVINGWKIHQSFGKNLHENRELLVGGLFAVPTSLVAVLVGATFPATGLRCLKKSGAMLESPGGTECCKCCECEGDTGEANS